MDLCTFPRMRPLNWLLFAVSALLFLPAGAEDGGRNARNAKPELRVRIVIVPTVLPPRHKDHDQDHDRDHRDAAILYDLSPSAGKVSISRETRSMLVGGASRPVQLTTLVEK